MFGFNKKKSDYEPSPNAADPKATVCTGRPEDYDGVLVSKLIQESQTGFDVTELTLNIGGAEVKAIIELDKLQCLRINNRMPNQKQKAWLWAARNGTTPLPTIMHEVMNGVIPEQPCKVKEIRTVQFLKLELTPPDPQEGRNYWEINNSHFTPITLICPYFDTDGHVAGRYTFDIACNERARIYDQQAIAALNIAVATGTYAWQNISVQEMERREGLQPGDLDPVAYQKRRREFFHTMTGMEMPEPDESPSLEL